MKKPLEPVSDATYLQLKDLPADFLDVVMREYLPYSVSLGRFRGEDPNTFAPLGSGTVITRKGRLGILTAHHCLHKCRPEVEVGHGGKDSIILGLRGGRGIRLSPEELYEHELARPVTEPFGPDLTFLELRPDKATSLLAISSAWPLEGDPGALRESFGSTASLIAGIGFPEVECHTDVKGLAVYRTYTHKTFINAIADNDIQDRGEWDYIDSTCNYAGSPDLPETFGGVSGGGIWSMHLGKDRKTGAISIIRSSLVGVTFYQGPLSNAERRLRGHFIRSIYDTAWREFESR